MAFKVEHDVMYNVNEETPHDINVSTASYEVSGISGTDEERRNTSPLFQSHELSSDWTDDEQSEDASSNLPPKKLKKAWEDDGTSAEKEREESALEKSSTDSASDPNPSSSRQYSLNDFDLIRVIGRGAYAKVFMVELKQTKTIYAMKAIKKDPHAEDDQLDRVRTEKLVLETASGHPFLVGLHSCFQTPSRLIFVMEMALGGDLLRHMEVFLRLPEGHARFYTAEIVLALNFLHGKGIVYRDLKLDNVLLDHEGHIKLADFGMCKAGIKPGVTTNSFCGTPCYIAPEVLKDEDYGFSVDWWSLGIMLHEMLLGRPPFDVACGPGTSQLEYEDLLFREILEKPVNIPRYVSAAATDAITGFLEKNPDDRLGCDCDGFYEISCHDFFRGIDWGLLEKKKMPPPYKPRLDSDRDFDCFSRGFTKELVRFTPDEISALDEACHTHFDGFDYTNPLLMAMEDCV